MPEANEHLVIAHEHLQHAAALLKRKVAERYCRDIPAGRLRGLLGIFSTLQEVKRLEAACQALLAPSLKK